MRTSVGWCAGRPADHGVADEADVAAVQLAAYPGTTAVREFRTGPPSVAWWSTQTLGAAGQYATRARQFDAVLSWTDVDGRPLRNTLESVPAWVDRVVLLGVHEMHNPSKGYTPERFAKDMAWITSEIPDRLRDRVVRAPCFIYYRSRITAPQETGAYLAPLLADDLIDAVMWDGYPSNPADVGKPGGATNPPTYEAPGSFLQHAREWMTETDLPYGWGELNFGRRASDPTGRARAAWFGDIYRGTRADAGLTVCQFHYNLADLIHESGYVEDDAWAALCRESEGCRIALDTAHEEDVAEAFRNGQDGAYADVAAYATGKIQQD
jgi:hypothetical protein